MENCLVEDFWTRVASHHDNFLEVDLTQVALFVHLHCILIWSFLKKKLKLPFKVFEEFLRVAFAEEVVLAVQFNAEFSHLSFLFVA